MNGTPYGAQVAADEFLFRAITYPHWWSHDQNRPSSAAFDDAVFSVDVASRTTESVTLARFMQGTGLVSFNCGEARSIGFDTRDELDDKVPENLAHAHVYFTGYDSLKKKQRKQLARQLAEKCQTIAHPSF